MAVMLPNSANHQTMGCRVLNGMLIMVYSWAVIEEEITEIPEGITVIATGPLTSEPLSKAIQAFNGSEGFYFYDAAAPIIDKSTIDMDKVYLKSRYDKGEAAYLNCPMNEEEFYAFREALVNAESLL